MERLKAIELGCSTESFHIDEEKVFFRQIPNPGTSAEKFIGESVSLTVYSGNLSARLVKAYEQLQR
jgi:hypothetical protein